MKNLLVISVLILLYGTSNKVFSQTYDGAFYEMFFGRQPSARAESMGRSIASIPGDANSYFYNPAGLAGTEGLNINGGYIESDNLFPKSTYTFLGTSYTFNKTGALGFSFEEFNTGSSGYDTLKYEKINTQALNYRMTISSEIIKDFYAGVNLNSFVPDNNFGNLSLGNGSGNLNKSIFYFDLGALKSFTFGTKNQKQKVNLGTSIINLNSADYYYSDGVTKGALPVIFRIGTSYNLLIKEITGKSFFTSKPFYVLVILANLEYVDVLNSRYFEGIHAGIEIDLATLLFVRAGFYTQNYPESIDCKSKKSQLCIGFGFNLAFLNMFTKGFWGFVLPEFDLIVDFASLYQPSVTNDKYNNDQYGLYQIKFNIEF